MAASTDILIGDAEGQHVLIRPVSRNHPGLFDEWDGNWIDCELLIAAGGFRGEFRANLRSDEFSSFLAQLQAMDQSLQGSASFVTMEEQLAVMLTRNGQGALHVEGEAADEAGGKNRLTFAFDLDQTYLGPICQSLEHLLAAFPVTGRADH